MKKTFMLAGLLAALASPGAMAGNYAACILDKMQGIQNTSAAQAAIRLCLKEYPAGFPSVVQGSGRGLFSFKSGDECMLKRGADIQNGTAAHQVRMACNRLYNEPPPPRPAPRRLVPYDGPYDPLPTRQ